MTREEAIAQLKMDRDLANFNPMTGEEEPMNEDCRKSVEALDMAIKALEQQRWIPVNKELPKKDGEYLVTVGGEATFTDVDTAWFYYGHWIHQFGCTVKVIAWMPLPEPYREERTEE